MLKSLVSIVHSDYFKLVPIIALAFFMSFIPHLSYVYAVHIDEWEHIAQSNAILRAGSINYPDPFPGQESGFEITRLELGHHLPLAVFQRISGVDWMVIARYLPSIVFIFTVLSVYVLGSRMGFGWEAAFFTTLIPTTVGIMGPAFLIPVALALMFVPLLLLLVLDFQTTRSKILLFLLISFLIILHAASAVLAILILIPIVLLRFKDNLKNGFGTLLSLVLPFLITLPWTANLIFNEAGTLFVQKPLPEYHDFLKIFTGYGYIPVIFSLIGTFFLVMRGKSKEYGLAASLFVLVAMLAVFYTLHYGISLLYLRGLLFAMLMMGIVAGAGLSEIGKLNLPWIKSKLKNNSQLSKIAGISISVLIIGFTLTVSIPRNLETPYYYMIDKTDFDSFTWIRNNVGTNGTKAIVDPWKATPFNAITGEYVYTRIQMAPDVIDNQAYEFLRNGSANTTFLKENGINIVYTRVFEGNRGENIEYIPHNPDLIMLTKNVYAVK